MSDAEEHGNGHEFEFDFALSQQGNYLTVGVGDTVLELLPMGDLPARKVMGLLSSKQTDRLEAALELMKLAAKNPAEFERDSEFISFDELIAAIDLWMDKSSAYSSGHRDALLADGKAVVGSSTKFGFGHTSKKLGKQRLELSTDIEDESVAIELAQAIAEAIEEASHIYHKAKGELEDMTEEQVILAVAMWFVKEGRADELITSGLLSPKSRTGKYYPIIDKKVSRRFGFTEEEAKEWTKWQ